MAPLSSADKYRNTPRKVFDKSMDRIELRIQRIKEDYRADIAAVLARVDLLESNHQRLVEFLKPVEEPEDGPFDKYFGKVIHKDQTRFAPSE